jgi:hypothetical protein
MDADLEAEFVASWDKVEARFTKLKPENPEWQWVQDIPLLLQELRQRGYDRKVRIGTSMHDILFSRTRKYHIQHHKSAHSLGLYSLGSESTHLKLVYRTLNLFPPPVKSSTESKIVPQVAWCPELEEWLERLAAQPISEPLSD